MTRLKRLRLSLDAYDATLLVVGDVFDEGGRFAQAVVSNGVASSWTWLEFDEQYDRLSRQWRASFGD